MAISGVYRVWCSDRHFYYGRSSDIEERCSKHLRLLTRGKHINPHMQAAFNKHGVFRFEILQEATLSESVELEQSLIDANIHDPCCMNICPFANAPTRKGRKNSPEHNAAISASRKFVKLDKISRERMSKGQKKRFELGWPADLREAMLLKRDTEEYRKKLSDALKGRSIPRSVRDKISESCRGLEKTPETRKKLSDALRGRVFSEDHRRRLSEANKGKKLSEETKARMRESHRIRLQLQRGDICLEK